MAKTKTKPMPVGVEYDILATAHSLAVALHRVGVMDDVKMREMDRLCLPPRPVYVARF